MVRQITLDSGFPLQACAMTRRSREMGLAAGGKIAPVLLPDAMHLIPPDQRAARSDRGF
jgi:hypothetical protein